MIKIDQYQLFIFDLDDTIITTSSAYKKALFDSCQAIVPQHLFSKNTFSKKQLLYLAQAFGTSNSTLYFQALIQLLSVSNQEEADQLVQNLNKKFQSLFFENLFFYDKIESILLQLARSFPIYVVTNGNLKKQQSKIALFKLERFFKKEAIYISGSYEKEQQKPSSHMIDLILAQHQNITKESILFFGDKNIDMLAGQIAGIKTALFCANGKEDTSYLPSPPTFIFHSWNELALQHIS